MGRRKARKETLPETLNPNRQGVKEEEEGGGGGWDGESFTQESTKR